MGIEVYFAQVDPNAPSAAASDLLYHKASVKSESLIPIVSRKEAQATIRPNMSASRTTLRPTTSTTGPIETQPSPAAGGAEGGQNPPVFRPNEADETYVDTIPPPFVPEIDVPPPPEKGFPWRPAIIGTVGFLLVVGFVRRGKK